MLCLQDIKTTQAVFTLKTIYTYRDKRVTNSKTSKKDNSFPSKIPFW